MGWGRSGSEEEVGWRGVGWRGVGWSKSEEEVGQRGVGRHRSAGGEGGGAGGVRSGKRRQDPLGREEERCYLDLP
jgi:hypothetical protein